MKISQISLTKQFDFIVIGSGPAGLSLALELSRKSKSIEILIIESGSRFVTEDSQANNEGLNLTKFLNEDPKGSRARSFGGTSSFWGGECSAFDEDDFLKKDWLSVSGWPIMFNDLKSYYLSAAEFLKLNNFDHVGNRQSNGVVTEKLWHYSVPPVRLASEFYEKIQDSDQISLLTSATAVGLEAQGSKLVAVNCHYNGQITKLSGKHFIIAGGGIENCRNLLEWKLENSELPIRSDLIGRYFCVHPYFAFDSGLILFNKADSFDYQITDQKPSKFHFMLSSEVRSEKKFHNFVLMPWTRVSDIDEISLPKVLKEKYRSKKPACFNTVNIMCEMPLKYESYIGLSQARNRLNQRIPNIHLHLDAEIVSNWNRGVLHLMQSFVDHDLGRIKYAPDKFEFSFVQQAGLWGAHHHLCGTRMSENEASGVVDRNLKVFGTDNLFIAGSSTFGTGAVPNPTLTIVALSLRLADHLLKIS